MTGKFTKGTSGNPGGKPKKRVHTVVNGVEGDYTELEIFLPHLPKAAQIMIDTLSHRTASSADKLKAAFYIADRIFGKPRQALEVSGENGGPVQTEAVGPDYSKLSTDDLRSLEAIHAKLADPAA